MENYNGELKVRKHPKYTGKEDTGINQNKSHDKRNSRNYENQSPHGEIPYLQNKEDDFKIKPCYYSLYKRREKCTEQVLAMTFIL